MSEGVSISFGSPRAPLTAAAARMTSFDTVRRHGLDAEQVADFVDHVCETISALSRARDEAVTRAAALSLDVETLTAEVATLTRQRDTAAERSEFLTREVEDLRDRLSKSPGEAAAEVLMLAHEAAASTAERAAEAAAMSAERIIADAEAEADRRRLLVTTELAGRVARVEYLTRVETELCAKLSSVADQVRGQLDNLPGLGLDALNVIDAVQSSVDRAERSPAHSRFGGGTSELHAHDADVSDVAAPIDYADLTDESPGAPRDAAHIGAFDSEGADLAEADLVLPVQPDAEAFAFVDPAGSEFPSVADSAEFPSN